MLITSIFSLFPRVCIHQSFSRKFFVFFIKIYKLECNTTSNWLNCTGWPIRSCEVVLHSNVSKYRNWRTRLRTFLRMIGEYQPWLDLKTFIPHNMRKGFVCIFDRLTLYQTAKNVDLYKLKAFEHENLIVVQMMEFLIDRVENIEGKGENAGYQYFLLFLHSFEMSFLFESLSWDCVVQSKSFTKQSIVRLY